MIAKAKAIAHGREAIEYALRESKRASLVASNLVQNESPKAIYKEFLALLEWNTRCKNKFIRIEIGIAPGDEKKLGEEDLGDICREFSRRFSFENHQWIGCVHRDTAHLHLHMIINRIGVDCSVYNTSFISKRAGKIAESISRDMGLTIANQVKRKSKYQQEVMSFDRILSKILIGKAAGEVLARSPTSLKEFTEMMKKHEIDVLQAVNRKGNTYGLRFSGYNQIFKASQIAKELGYRTLLSTFKENSRVLRENSRLQLKLKQLQLEAFHGVLLSGLGAWGAPDMGKWANKTKERKEGKRHNQKKKKRRNYGPKF